MMNGFVLAVASRLRALVPVCAMVIAAGFALPSSVIADDVAGEGTEFALAPGDILKFDILDDDRDPVDLPVGTDGQIQAPFLGGVLVSGRTVSDAMEEVKKRYREGQIFNAPRIALSVATHRPVYVLGDVRNPGSYPFQPDLTVEKALGLAGGQVVAAASDDPATVRARLRGEMEALDMSIAGSSLAIGRLNAQLAGRTDIVPADIPAESASYVDGPAANSQREVELNILRSDAANAKQQKELLVAGVAEAERGQKILDELATKTKDSIGFSRAERDRAKDLQAKGIKTVTEVSNVERQLMLEEARQLQVLANLSEGRRGLLVLRRQLAELDENRRMKALTSLVLERNNLAKGIAQRRSAEEQLMLLSSRTLEDLRMQKEVVLDFTIRHGTVSSSVGIEVASSRTLAPGDVLVVSIRDTTPPAVAAVPANEPASQ
jgi:protein involved in polysaccharide export with SLBB domain